MRPGRCPKHLLTQQVGTYIMFNKLYRTSQYVCYGKGGGGRGGGGTTRPDVNPCRPVPVHTAVRLCTYRTPSSHHAGWWTRGLKQHVSAPCSIQRAASYPPSLTPFFLHLALPHTFCSRISSVSTACCLLRGHMVHDVAFHHHHGSSFRLIYIHRRPPPRAYCRPRYEHVAKVTHVIRW
jgi:hypothetical protein